MTIKLKDLARHIDTVPTLPVVVMRIQRLMSNPQSSAKEITQEISKDPALTARLLKIVNSVHYGLSRQVSTLSHAIVLLGFTQVRNIVVASSMKNLWKSSRGDEVEDREELWRHCLATAIIAKELARRIEYSQYEEIFIGGLLHDIGKIILDSFLHDQYSSVHDYVIKHDVSFYVAEQQVIKDFTHTDLGSAIAMKWKLPDLLVDIIRFHHHPEECTTNRTEVSLVHVANVIARIKGIGRGGDLAIPAIDSTAWAILNFPETKIEQLMSELDTLLAGHVLLREAELWPS